MTIVSEKFDVKVRDDMGSSHSRRFRKNGYIPAIIYDKKNNINISIPEREFNILYNKGNILSTVVELEFILNNKKEKYEAIVNKIDIHPLTDIPIHIVLIKLEKDSIIKFSTNVNFIGQSKSPGIKKGGFLHIAQRRLKLSANNKESIIPKIDIDISSYHIGDSICSSDIKLPDNLSLIKTKRKVIASITGRGSSVKDQEEEESTGEDKVKSD